MPKTLRLYHYACIKNLFGISVAGLTPCKDDPPLDIKTMGQPVVWLTTQETIKPTQADLNHMARHVGEQDAEAFREQMFIGRDTRLTVNLSTMSKRLVHYHTWLRTTKIAAITDDPDAPPFTGNDFLRLCSLTPSAREHWWVYFGTIKPARIELKMTAGLALPGIEENLASAIEKGDADRIARLTELRDHLSALPHNQLVRFNEVDDTAEAAA
jgi:hypothetical protein